MKELVIGVLVLVFSMGQATAQFENSGQDITREYDNRSFGLGLGIEYGSILGIQYTHYFVPNLGVVAAGGLVKNGISGGIGLKYRPWILVQPKFVTYYFSAMYGPVGGSTVIFDRMVEDKLFYGGHVGLGVEIRDKKWKRAFFKFAFHLTHDFGAFENYKTEVKDRGIEISGNTRGYSFSLGYHYAF